MRVLLIVRLSKVSVLNIISGVVLCGDKVMMTLEDDLLLKVKVKQSCYRPGVAQRVPGS
jgi:hypothetical protein